MKTFLPQDNDNISKRSQKNDTTTEIKYQNSSV